MIAITTTPDIRYLVNGTPSDRVSVLDRGLRYGDGLFETIAVRDGNPCHWRRHWQRLADGCAKLAIPVPEKRVLERDCRRLCNNMSQAVLKIIVTRGTEGQGYRPSPVQHPSCIVGLSSLPDYPRKNTTEGIAVCLCQTRLGINPALAGIKHLNRLEQVLASREWHGSQYAEGLMMDADDNVIEGTRTNLFIVKDNRLYTPDLSRCGVAGVMRAVVLELAVTLQLSSKISSIDRQQLVQADEVFVTNSLIGLWPVQRVDRQRYVIGAVTRRLMASLQHCPESSAA